MTGSPPVWPCLQLVPCFAWFLVFHRTCLAFELYSGMPLLRCERLALDRAVLRPWFAKGWALPPT